MWFASDSFPSPLPCKNAFCKATVYIFSRTTHASTRSGGTRTPNRRFWKPELCQLSYAPKQTPLSQSPPERGSPAKSSASLTLNFMGRVLALTLTILRELDLRGAALNINASAIVQITTLLALEPHVFPFCRLSHARSLPLSRRKPSPPCRSQNPAVSRTQTAQTYSITLTTTPEPTVRPPSRTAKRSPSSIPIGLPSSISISMLSPGMHISAPLSVNAPVTSVVRK